jgi:hypothetical protein
MDGDGKVCLPRAKLAAELGISERRVTVAITTATQAGYLENVVRGQKGVTAIYRCALPPPANEERGRFHAL